jgi:protein-disulfide isomerase
MQKKTAPAEQPHNSEWQNSLKKQERMDMMKKIGIWAGIIFACIAGLAVLVALAGNSGPSTEPVVKENLKAISKDDIVLGKPTAKIEIIEYADFQCPSCAAYNPVVKQILAEYDGRVKVAFRHFPLRSIHKNAQIAGQAGYAAWKLGKFEEMKDLLYDNQADWENVGDPRDVYIGYAKKIGLDELKFEEIMNSDEAEKAVRDDEAEAISLGLNSTPSFFVGKKQIQPQGYDSFKEVIDEELKASGEKPTTKPLQ